MNRIKSALPSMRWKRWWRAVGQIPWFAFGTFYPMELWNRTLNFKTFIPPTFKIATSLLLAISSSPHPTSLFLCGMWRRVGRWRCWNRLKDGSPFGFDFHGFVVAKMCEWCWFISFINASLILVAVLIGKKRETGLVLWDSSTGFVARKKIIKGDPLTTLDLTFVTFSIVRSHAPVKTAVSCCTAHQLVQ